MTSIEEIFVRNANREMTFTPTEKEELKTANVSITEEMTESIQFQPNKNKNTATQLASAPFEGRCPTHPEEDLQFFCYNNGKTLCAECLIKGDNAGMEIVSLRRAGEKAKTKIGELLSEANGKLETVSVFEKELDTYEDQINQIALQQKEEITNKIASLRQALDQKEQELLNKVAIVHADRQNKAKAAVSNLETHKKELESVKTTIENKLSSSDDLSICQFYLTQANAIKGQLNTEINPRILKSKKVLERYQSRDENALQKLQEGWKNSLSNIESLSCEIPNEQRERSHSPTETSKSSNRVTFAATSSLNKSYSPRTVTEPFSSRLKNSISKEISITESVTPFKLEGYQNYNSLSRTLHGEESSPITSLAQLSRRSPRVGDTENSKLSYLNQKNGPPMLESYREQFSKKTSLREVQGIPMTPKSEANKAHSIAITPKIASTKLLLDATAPLTRSPRFASSRKWVVEPIFEQSKSTKNVYEAFSSATRPRNATMSSYIKSEELDTFDFGSKTSIPKKSSRQFDSFTSSDNKLKQKLEKLSYTIFN